MRLQGVDELRHLLRVEVRIPLYPQLVKRRPLHIRGSAVCGVGSAELGKSPDKHPERVPAERLIESVEKSPQLRTPHSALRTCLHSTLTPATRAALPRVCRRGDGAPNMHLAYGRAGGFAQPHGGSLWAPESVLICANLWTPGWCFEGSAGQWRMAARATLHSSQRQGASPVRVCRSCARGTPIAMGELRDRT